MSQILLDFAETRVYNGVEDENCVFRRFMEMVADCSGEEVPLLRLLPMMYRLVQLTDAHKKYGLTKSQAVVLIALHYRESVTMSEIAQYLSSSKEQATRAVAALYDAGLVDRFELPANRTHVYIRFTDSGKEFMQTFSRQLREEISKRLENSLSPEELQTLRSSVQTTIEILGKVK